MSFLFQNVFFFNRKCYFSKVISYKYKEHPNHQPKPTASVWSRKMLLFSGCSSGLILLTWSSSDPTDPSRKRQAKSQTQPQPEAQSQRQQADSGGVASGERWWWKGAGRVPWWSQLRVILFPTSHPSIGGQVGWGSFFAMFFSWHYPGTLSCK